MVAQRERRVGGNGNPIRKRYLLLLFGKIIYVCTTRAMLNSERRHHQKQSISSVRLSLLIFLFSRFPAFYFYLLLWLCIYFYFLFFIFFFFKVYGCGASVDSILYHCVYAYIIKIYYKVYADIPRGRAGTFIP